MTLSIWVPEETGSRKVFRGKLLYRSARHQREQPQCQETPGGAIPLCRAVPLWTNKNRRTDMNQRVQMAKAYQAASLACFVSPVILRYTCCGLKGSGKEPITSTVLSMLDTFPTSRQLCGARGRRGGRKNLRAVLGSLKRKN